MKRLVTGAVVPLIAAGFTVGGPALSDDYTTIHEYKLQFLVLSKMQLLEN